MRKLFTLFVAALCCASMFAEGPGELTGRFTINEQGDQIVFSKGNLQYQASTHTWRFAERQWDFVGGRASASDPLEGNVFENGVQCSNNKISDSYSGWIDLFGWGTGYQPTRTKDPVAAFVDWGANAISNGGDEAYLWRSLTEAEWKYILETRYQYKQATTGGSQKALIDGVNGYIIFPDDWDKTWNPDSWTLIPSEWQALEDKGAVFLPAGGRREGSTVKAPNSSGNYWTSSENNSTQAYEASFSTASNISVNAKVLKEYGRSVRLVKVVCTGCKPVHIVTFHAKDGSKYTTREVLDGQTLTKLPSPYSEDDPENIYTFIGWNMNLSKPITSDMDVYPVYEPTEPRRVLTGRFSVSEDKQVAFAAGNLQYRPFQYRKETNSGTLYVEGSRYRIATNQYDVIGVLNVNAQYGYCGLIDLFGFATGNSPTETSKETANYSTGELTGTIALNFGYDWVYRYRRSEYYREEDFADYDDTYGLRYNMRLLSAAEWDYLLKTRPNAADLQGHAEVCGVKGYLLLPDDWQAPQGISFTPNPVNYTTNVYNQWSWDKMEAAGAVFLPATGFRYGTVVNAVHEDGPFNGYYWTGDFDDASTAKAAVLLSTSELQVMDAMRENGYAVRPVVDCGAWMDTATGIEDVQGDKVPCTKVLRDGQLYIMYKGTMYNVQGQEVK